MVHTAQKTAAKFHPIFSNVSLPYIHCSDARRSQVHRCILKRILINPMNYQSVATGFDVSAPSLFPYFANELRYKLEYLG